MSALLAMAYIVVAFVTGGPATAVKMVFCVVSLFCVWFPDVMGSYIGLTIGPVTRESPAEMVWLMGWVVLLLPIVQFLLIWAML